MADNLSITVSADTAKLRAQLAIAQASVREFGAQLRQMAAAAGATSLDPKLNQVAAQYEAARASVSGLANELHGAKAASESMTESFRVFPGLVIRAREGISSLKEVAEAAGAAFAFDKIKEGVESFAELGEKTINIAAAVGTSAAAYSRIAGAIQLAGGNAETATRVLLQLERAAQDALTNPNGEQASTFAALGISAEQLKAGLKDLPALLYAMADAYNRFADDPAKARAMGEALGRRGLGELIPALAKGSAGFKELEQRVVDLGLAQPETMLEALKSIADKIHEVRGSFTGIGAELVSEWEAPINAVLDAMVKINAEIAKRAREGSTQEDYARGGFYTDKEIETNPIGPAIKSTVSSLYDWWARGINESLHAVGLDAYEFSTSGAPKKSVEQQQVSAPPPNPESAASPAPAAAAKPSVPQVDFAKDQKDLETAVKAIEGKLKVVVAQYALEIAEAKGNASKIAALEEQKVAAVRAAQQQIQAIREQAAQKAEALGNKELAATFRDASAAQVETLDLQKQQVELAQGAQEQRLHLAEQSAAHEAQTLSRELAEFKATNDAKVADGQISKAEAVRLEAEKQAQIYAIERSTQEQIRDDLAATADQRKTAQEKLEELAAAHTAKMADYQKELSDAVERETQKQEQFYEGIFGKMESAFDSAIAGIVSHTETWAKALKSLRTSVITSVTDGITKALSAAAASALAKPLGVTFKEGETPSLSGLASNLASKAFGSMFGLGPQNASKDAAVLKNVEELAKNTAALNRNTEAKGGAAAPGGHGAGNIPAPVSSGAPSTQNVPVSVTGVAPEATSQAATGPAPGGMPTDQALALIEQYESGGRNILQTAYSGQGINPSTGTHTAPSTASGYYQIEDSTWRSTAPQVGVDTGQYPTAMSAPREVQQQVAGQLYNTQGFAPWAPYNPKLAAAISAQQNQTAAVPSASDAAAAPGAPIAPVPVQVEELPPATGAAPAGEAALPTASDEAAVEQQIAASEALGTATTSNTTAVAGLTTAVQGVSAALEDSKSSSAAPTPPAAPASPASCAAPPASATAPATGATPASSPAPASSSAPAPPASATAPATGATPASSPAPASSASSSGMPDTGSAGLSLASLSQVIGPLTAITGLLLKGSSPLKTDLEVAGSGISLLSALSKLVGKDGLFGGLFGGGSGFGSGLFGGIGKLFGGGASTGTGGAAPSGGSAAWPSAGQMAALKELGIDPDQLANLAKTNPAAAYRLAYQKADALSDAQQVEVLNKLGYSPTQLDQAGLEPPPAVGAVAAAAPPGSVPSQGASAQMAVQALATSATQANTALGQTSAAVSTLGTASSTAGASATEVGTNFGTAGTAAATLGTDLSAAGQKATSPASGAQASTTGAAAAGTASDGSIASDISSADSGLGQISGGLGALTGSSFLSGISRDFGAFNSIFSGIKNIGSLFGGLFGLLSLDAGTPEVRGDGLAFIHSGESVLDAPTATAARNIGANPIEDLVNAASSIPATPRAIIPAMPRVVMPTMPSFGLPAETMSAIGRVHSAVPSPGSIASALDMGSGGNNGSDTHVHLHVHAFDGRSAHRTIMDNRDSIAEAVHSARKNFNRKAG